MCNPITWTIKASDARRITAAEMKHMRRTAGYTWTDYKTNTQIHKFVKELKITSILDKLLECKRSWIQHVNRVPRHRLRRVMKHYPTGGAWMLVCCECCVLSGKGLCDELITRPEESYRL